jgi:hypothetical protein
MIARLSAMSRRRVPSFVFSSTARLKWTFVWLTPMN